MNTSSTLPSRPRFDSVDALRGFAIIAILLLHCIERFNFYTFPDKALESELMLYLNKQIWESMFFLFGSKAYGIFALLFGFTFHLQYSKRAAKGEDFGPRFLWRMVLLFCFGWVNAIFFPGEVLILYAVLAPSLFLIRNWPDRYVLGFALFFLLQPMLLTFFSAKFFSPDFVIPKFAGGAYWHQMMSYLKEGSFLVMVQNSYKGVLMTFDWSTNNGRVCQAVGLFALGLYLGRKNMFSEEKIKEWAIILLVALVCFTVLSPLLQAVEQSNAPYAKPLRKLVKSWRNLSQLLVMVSLFLLLFRTDIFKKMVSPLKAYGRMSLTNYVMQSIVGGLIFYPYGMSLAYSVNVTYSLLIGVVLMVVFVAVCNWWITHYRQGPLEKLWHRLTWLPAKRKSSEKVVA